VDGSAFYALSLLGTAHDGRDFAIYMRSAAVLEPIFPANPQHPGIAHYLIHSYDDPIHAPLGLRAARAYSKIAPTAGHAQHMCSHIFVAMGMWADVVEANEAAVKVVDLARAKRGQPPSACGHYNFWLEYGYLEQGRVADAKKLLSNCYATAQAAAARQPGGAMVTDPDNSSIVSFAEMRARFVIDVEDWKTDVLGWTVATPNQPVATILTAFADGFAAVRRGDAARAGESLDALAAARRALEANLSKTGATEATRLSWARILDDQLTALARMPPNSAQAIAKLRETAGAEDKLPFEFGPPAIDKPSFELLGEVQLAAGQPKDARVAFEKQLVRTPDRTMSLRGLMRAAQQTGDTRKAAEIDAKLRAIQQRPSTSTGSR